LYATAAALPRAAAAAAAAGTVYPKHDGLVHQVPAKQQFDPAHPLMYNPGLDPETKQDILQKLVTNLVDVKSVVGRRVEEEPGTTGILRFGSEIEKKLSELPIPGLE
jgi:hypothetical protein